MVKGKKVKLPAFTLRVSPRARYVWFKISYENGLEIIVPRGFNHKRIPELLIKEKGWIQRNIKRMREKRKTLQQQDIFSLIPDRIELQAIGEVWKVYYRKAPIPGVRIIQNKQSITLWGQVNRKLECHKILQEWLEAKARKILIPWLRRLSREKDLPFGKILVKGQRSIWASCSRYKTISVNFKLLLIPRHLVRYVLIHELCHTMHLNHSRRFWALVAQKEPKYKQYDKDLRFAWQSLPPWVHT